MFKVLIVDDEKATREALRDLVSWGSLGFGDVSVARNGEEALSQMERKCPDLLLCDVRMPKLDGVQLSLKTHRLHPACRILFLSGYSDSEYLKTAIKVRAEDYINKPIDLAVITDAVRKVAESLTSERNDKHMRDANARFLRLKLAAGLLRSGSFDPATLAAFGEASDGSPSAAVVHAAWAVPPGAHGSFFAGPLRVAVLHLQEGVTQNGGSGVDDDIVREAPEFLFHRYSEDTMVFVAEHGGESVSGEEIFLSRLRGLERYFSPNQDSLYWTVATAFAGPAAVPDAFERALAASRLHFYEPGGHVLYADDMKTLPFEINEGQRDRLTEAVLSADTVAIGDSLRSIADASRISASGDTDSVRAAFRAAVDLVCGLVGGLSVSDRVSIQEKAGKMCSTAKTLDQLCGLVVELVVDLLKIDGEGSGSHKIARVKQLVRDHYTDPNMSVKFLASAVQYSESYLSTLFCRETGITINKYITALRMEKACELLRGSDEKLQSIAATVGFRDVNYFSTLFKKFYQVTPGSYRAKMLS